MRLRLLGLLMALLFSVQTQAQQYGLEVEVVSENIGPLVGALGVTDLSGYSCYRAYVTMENEDDFLSSISGDSNNPTYVTSSTGMFYQAVLGGATPNGINSLLFGVYPDLAYDSWVTIGLEGVPDAVGGEAAVATVQASGNPWTTVFDPGGGLPGGNIAIDDLIGGAWYALNGDANGVAGPDLKVLAGQFTTTGDIELEFYTQIFINGEGTNEVLVDGDRPTFSFPAAGGTPGCTDAEACNFDAEATEDDGSCTYPNAGLDCDGNCLDDADGDGICDGDEIPGCQDDMACNYNENATDDDGSCEFTSCVGCTDDTACNYDATATIADNATCTYPGDGLDCDGNCLADADGDGICDGDEEPGCGDITACNYDENATDPGPCSYPEDGLDCDGNCLADADGDGICDGDEVAGCQDDMACNYDPNATDDDGSCTYPDAGLDCNGNCLADADGDGICDEDEVAGCADDTACNYDPNATDDDGSCTYPDAGLDCDGNCLADADGDGTCDDDEIAGCQDETACNYDADATDPAECTYAEDGLDCNGNCLADADGDGICDGDEVAGCADAEACNYDADATDDDGSCTYPTADNLDCNGNCLNDVNENGICDEDESFGCTDPMACNYDAEATTDSGSCTYPDAGLDCDGNCLADADGDGICDGDEIPGCTDSAACNYDADATDDDGSCESLSCAGCTDNGACNYDDAATIDDGSCEFTSCAGCTDAMACNYDGDATLDDASCTYPAADNLDCDGNCLNDDDADGICNEDEIGGCTDTEALNYDATATDNDGSCEYPCAPEWGDPVTYPSVATVLALVTVDGDMAAMDDAVAAYVDGELRGEGDIIEFEGATYINMSVYLTGGMEMVDFVFFNQDECSTCSIDAELEAMEFGEYGSFADPLMFDANCADITLEVELMEGWNYVSTNVTPVDYAISSLFEDALEGNLLKVLGDDAFALGGSYTPGIPSVFNSLQMHTDAAGYVIKVEETELWGSTGAALDAANTPLDLNEGWNIIGYVPQAAMAVADALASIDGAVGTVIDGQNGTVWNPANPNEFNSLLELEPGRSYWIRLLEAATLTYPQAAGDGSGMALAALRSASPAETMTGWSVVRAPFAAALAAEIRLDEAPVDGEAYIGAFDGETCVAARPVLDVNGWSGAQMAVMLEQPANISFRLWVDGVEFQSNDVLDMTIGDEFGQGGDILPILRFSSAANAVVDANWVRGFSLSPMPAMTTSWLDLDLNAAGQARIAVLDARGAEVAVLHDGQLAAGQHRMALDVSNWAAGTYFVKGMSSEGTFRCPLIVQ